MVLGVSDVVYVVCPCLASVQCLVCDAEVDRGDVLRWPAVFSHVTEPRALMVVAGEDAWPCACSPAGWECVSALAAYPLARHQPWLSGIHSGVHVGTPLMPSS